MLNSYEHVDKLLSKFTMTIDVNINTQLINLLNPLVLLTTYCYIHAYFMYIKWKKTVLCRNV